MSDWDEMKARAAAANAEKTVISGEVVERYNLPPKGSAFVGEVPIALVRDDATGQLVEVALFGFRGDPIEVGACMETRTILVEGSQPDRKGTKRSVGTRVITD